MSTPRLLVPILASVLLVGCKPASTSNAGRSAAPAAAGKAWPFEGNYFDANYNDEPPVTFKAGQYHGAWPSNPGGSMDGSGKYTVRETGNGTWELDFQYDTGGRKTVVYVRKDGDDILIRDAAGGGETRLRKK